MTALDRGAGPATQVALAPRAGPARRWQQQWGWRSVREWLLPAFAVLAMIVAHVNAARDAFGPVWPEDEIGLIANSRVLAGTDPAWQMGHLPYYPGWSLAMAPLWAVVPDQVTFYRVAILLCLVVVVVTLVPLATLARRLGANPPVAVAVSALVMTTTARTVFSNYVLSEHLLTLVTAVLAITAWDLCARPTWQRAVLFGALSAFAFFTHGRAVVALVAAASLLAGMFLSARRRVALAGAAAVVAGAAVAYLAYRGIVTQIYDSSGARESRVLDRILAPNVLGVLRAGVGQLWYQLAAWCGVTIIGLIAVFAQMRRDWLARRVGPALWAGVGVVALLGLTSFQLSDALGAAVPTRTDYWMYGRYLDSFVVPLAVVGLVQLRRLEGLRRIALLVCSAVWAAYGLTSAFVMTSDAPTAVLNVGGLAGWVAAGVPLNSWVPWAASALTTAVVLAAGPHLARRGVAAWTVLAVLAAGLSFVSEARVMDPTNRAWRTDRGLADVVDLIAPGSGAVAFDTQSALRGEGNRATFWLSPREVLRFDSRTEHPPAQIVVAAAYWPEARTLGARRVTTDPVTSDAVWVLPGDLQARLVVAGWLDEDALDPIADHRYQLTIDTVGGADCLAGRAEPCSVSISVDNSSSSAWLPHEASQGRDGAVRVVGWWQSEGEVRAQVWDLERTVLPGMSVEMELRFVPPPEWAGRTVLVELGLVQEGVGGFPGVDADLPGIKVSIAG